MNNTGTRRWHIDKTTSRISNIGELMLPTIATGNVGSALAGEYEVANSLRFDDGSSDYLSRSYNLLEMQIKL